MATGSMWQTAVDSRGTRSVRTGTVLSSMPSAAKSGPWPVLPTPSSRSMICPDQPLVVTAPMGTGMPSPSAISAKLVPIKARAWRRRASRSEELSVLRSGLESATRGHRAATGQWHEPERCLVVVRRGRPALTAAQDEQSGIDRRADNGHAEQSIRPVGQRLGSIALAERGGLLALVGVRLARAHLASGAEIQRKPADEGGHAGAANHPLDHMAARLGLRLGGAGTHDGRLRLRRRCQLFLGWRVFR